MYDLEKISEKVRKYMTQKRYIHTQGVRYTAACMAMCHDVSVELASVAGLLHDNAKCLSDEEMLKKCKKYQIPVRPIEKKHPYLLHGRLGAYYAKKRYEITEEEVLSAITFHTTGKPDMTALEKIIFIADYIEPGRKLLPGMEEIRKYAFKDLDMCTYLILKNTISYLQEKKDADKEMDTLTIEAYEYYKKLIEQRN